jgi:two-component system, NtrC family, sensor histidine kinase GlrK
MGYNRKRIKFGIFQRLTAGYVAILFLLGLANVYALLILTQLNTRIFDSYNEGFRLLDINHRIVDALSSQQRYGQKYIITRDPDLYRQFLIAKEDFERSLLTLRDSSSSAEMKSSINRVIAKYQLYKDLMQTEMTALKARQAYDTTAYRIRKENASDDIFQEIKRLGILSRKEFDDKMTTAAQVEVSTRRAVIASFVFTLVLVVALSLYVTRSITNPISKLIKKTREIQNGRFDCNIMVSDPPEVMELAEAFRRMCEQLKQVDQLKADFFAMISHELRTPLTTIREGTNLLLEGKCGSNTEKQKRMLSIIGTESNRLIELVNSILDLSRMEAGMMPYHFEKSSVEPLIDRAMAEISPHSDTKGIKIEKRISSTLPPASMDSERILEVLRNLFGNAIKFTPEGGQITLTAGIENGEVMISITDTGPGISKDRLVSIFDKYESSDRKKGTGLGLAIAKHIITAHKGTIWAQSDPGKGSRFIFTLPF